MDSLPMDIWREIVTDENMYNMLIRTRKWENGFNKEIYWHTRFGVKFVWNRIKSIPLIVWPGFREAIKIVWTAALRRIDSVKSCKSPMIGYIGKKISFSVHVDDGHICVKYNNSTIEYNTFTNMIVIIHYVVGKWSKAIYIDADDFHVGTELDENTSDIIDAMIDAVGFNFKLCSYGGHRQGFMRGLG